MASLGVRSLATKVRVDGYASTDGDETYNLLLSCRRAKAIKEKLGKKHHIPEGNINIFAHGETSEFSNKELAKNRIVIISAATGPAPKPDCNHPGSIRTVEVQPIFFKNSAADPSPTGTSWKRRLAESNKIWSKLGVSAVELSPITLVDATRKSSDAVSQAEKDRVLAGHSGPGVEVFVLDSDLPTRGGGTTGAGGTSNAKVILSDRGASNTLLAHELGHVFGLGHPPADADPDTIMKPSGSNAASNPTRNTIGNFNRITFPAPTGSTCLHPDP